MDIHSLEAMYVQSPKYSLLLVERSISSFISTFVQAFWIIKIWLVCFHACFVILCIAVLHHYWCGAKLQVNQIVCYMGLWDHFQCHRQLHAACISHMKTIRAICRQRGPLVDSQLHPQQQIRQLQMQLNQGTCGCSPHIYSIFQFWITSLV